MQFSIERLMTEVTLLKDQRLNFMIEVVKLHGNDDDLASIKAENIICKQRTEHSEKMYSLLKGVIKLIIKRPKHI